jgi:hypothetical protein
MSDFKPSIYITKNLFEVLKRRNYGEKGLVSPSISKLENLRMTTQWTGEIFEPQLETLKKNAILLGESPVTISIDTQHKFISFKFKKEVPPEKLHFFNDLVNATLGAGWTMEVTKETYEPPAITEESRKPAQPKRTRSSKKTRRKRK